MNKKLLEHANTNDSLLRLYFVNIECKKCMNTPLQKKRNCDLLIGYDKPCCKIMDNFIEKFNKPINILILNESLKTQAEQSSVS